RFGVLGLGEEGAHPGIPHQTDGVGQFAGVGLAAGFAVDDADDVQVEFGRKVGERLVEGDDIPGGKIGKGGVHVIPQGGEFFGVNPLVFAGAGGVLRV